MVSDPPLFLYTFPTNVSYMDATSAEGRASRLALDFDRHHQREKFGALLDQIDQNPDDAFLLWLCGIMGREAGRHSSDRALCEAGADAYRKLLGIWDVAPVLVHQTYANLLAEELDQEEAALPHRRLAVKLSPKGWSYQGLGNTLTDLNHFDEANVVFSNCLACAPGNPDYLYSWALSRKAAGDYENAIAKCAAALEQDPRQVKSYWCWACCLESQGKYREALAKLDEALKIDPRCGYVKGTRRRVKSKIDNGETEETWKEKNRKPPETQEQIAAGHLRAFDYDAAMKAYLRGAEQGRAESMWCIANMYAAGQGVPYDDDKESLYWQLAAAVHGHKRSADLVKTACGEWKRRRGLDAAAARLVAARPKIKPAIEQLLNQPPPRLCGDGPGIPDFSSLGDPLVITNFTLHPTQYSKVLVTDLSPIRRMKNLQRLMIWNCRATDYGPLADLSALERLTIYRSDLSDLSPLSGLTRLKRLSLHTDSISDLGPLAPLVNLESLNIQGNRIADISPLGSLTNLVNLDLSCNRIRDISAVSGMTRLTHLNLSFNQVTNISPLIDCASRGGFAGRGAKIYLRDNWLTSDTLTTDFPALRRTHNIRVVDYALVRVQLLQMDQARAVPLENGELPSLKPR